MPELSLLEFASAAPSLATGKSSILLVDDHPDNLVTLQASLEDLGQNLVAARSGSEALKHILERTFAVIVLDVKMPDIDGFELATLIHKRDRSRQTPIIFLTAYGADEIVAQGYSVGAVDFVVKPFVPEILRSKVAVFVNLFQTRQELERQLAETRRLNRELDRANLELGQSHAILEQRVLERTDDLAKAVVALKDEIRDRERAEELIKHALREKEVLLKEVQHRVKNNLQVVASLLSLQSGSIKDPRDLELFRESCNRVRAMALIHERFYHSRDLARIDFGEYIHNLALSLFRVYQFDSDSVRLTTRVEDVVLRVDTAIPCGLIVNELVSNALKHAFPEGKKGNVHIELLEDRPGHFSMLVRDDGVGLPADLDIAAAKSLGMQLVVTLVEQLNGELRVERNGGSQFRIGFGELNYPRRE